MVKVIATEDRLIIRQRLYIIMILYWGMVIAVGCFLFLYPDVVLVFILGGMIFLGIFFVQPLQTTLIYDRKRRHLIRETRYFGPLSTFRDESAAPDTWVIEVEFCPNDGNNYEVSVLTEYGSRFRISQRNNVAEILASYVAHWEDVEIFYYDSKFFGGRDQTGHRLYSKDHPGHIPSISEMNRVYLF